MKEKSLFKCRAWDKTTNQMRGCYGFNELEREVYVCSVADDGFNGQLETIHAFRRSFDKVVVMQYTGCRDKNGIEIYEGDVIKDKYDKIWLVQWYVGAFVITNKIPDSDGQTTTYSHFSNVSNHNFYFEVIGNIWEDGELLEVAEWNN